MGEKSDIYSEGRNLKVCLKRLKGVKYMYVKVTEEPLNKTELLWTASEIPR